MADEFVVQILKSINLPQEIIDYFKGKLYSIIYIYNLAEHICSINRSVYNAWNLLIRTDSYYNFIPLRDV